MRWGDGSRKVVRVLDVPVCASEKASRQIRWRNSRVCDEWPCAAKQSEVVPRKASKLQSNETVPQKNTSRRDEYSKALERTRDKDLGKLVKKQQKKEQPRKKTGLRQKDDGVAIN